jgi:CRISPR-associated endonuclease/helicase Cas3
MAAPDFSSFYKAVNGYAPFPWQEALAGRVLNREWPAIDVPTGCGKTSVMDVAVYALAVQAELPAALRTPLRVFFVVDRRLVVDDVYRHAQKLAAKIAEQETEATRWVRERLLLFGGASPLEVALMRGGMYRSNGWADIPHQPLVCVSTVDQVGSRLLFRGYGVSPSSRPIHAALVANDSLLIVDEAHLSRPFLETVQAVARFQGDGWRTSPTAPGVRLVEMSATRRAGSSASHSLTQADYDCQTLRPRLECSKVAELKEVTKLAETAAREAVHLANAGVIGVVLNTVSTARRVFEELRKEHDCVLLTGRVRPYDRDSILDKYLPRMRAGTTRAAGEHLFVVATQTIEVGADLDFDALVTEAAPLDSLRQRFGRLNRLGRSKSAAAVILKPRRTRDKDFIYGDAVDETWKWLNEHATENRIDFGVRTMGELFAAHGRPELLVKTQPAPLIFPAHLDAWAQTNPAPAVDPDVAPFLHGTDSETADVQIVWRADLDDVSDFNPMNWVPLLEAAPPVAAEALSLPFFAAKRWLVGRPAFIADVEGGEAGDESEENGAQRSFLIWRGAEQSSANPREFRPGDTIVVRATEGGCDAFGWNPDSDQPVRDVGDRCANARVRSAGGRYRIRIHRGVLPGLSAEVAVALDHAAAGDPIADEIRAAFQKAADAGSWGRVRAHGGKGLLVESGWKPPEELQRLQVAEADEAEGDASSLTAEVTFRAHTDAVVAKARQFAERCQMNGATTSIVEAAKRHDLGKLDVRFQFILSPATKGEPLAKSANISPAEYRRRKEQASYPNRARHEFASVLLAEQWGSWCKDCDVELALYLIGTHHGYGRPFPPVWEDKGYTIRVEVEGRGLAVQDVHRIGRLGSGWPDRYSALTRRYGWWGLAYLETILRRADCVVSREEEARSHGRA